MKTAKTNSEIISNLVSELELTPQNLQKGLLENNIAQRTEKYGLNKLEQKKGVSWIKILVKQFKNFIIVMLSIGAVISLITDETVNFWVILAIIITVILLGFFQEYRAEKALSALKSIIKPTIKVFRDGDLQEILAEQIVPGDLMSIEAGDKLPADGIVITANSLTIDESPLTGESQPINKEIESEVFAGTQVMAGKGSVVVSKTGMKTQLGKIAAAIQQDSKITPLQKKIDHLSKVLAIIGIFTCAITLVIGFFLNADLTKLLLISLTLAVATVPEGLPLTMTITLTQGMRKLAQSNAVVRKLIGVETLGSVTTICTDKTGTLTQNQMMVEKIFFQDNEYSISGKGYDPVGEIQDKEGEQINPLDIPHFDTFLKVTALNNNAKLVKGEDQHYEILGDPTEGALLSFAEKFGFKTTRPNSKYERIHEIVFSSERKMMTTVNRNGASDNGSIVLVKGAYEEVLDKSVKILSKKGESVLTNSEILTIGKKADELSNQAYRVLALAYKKMKSSYKPDSSSNEEIENELVFLGLVGMRDPAREESAKAVMECKQAGINVIMITGDNPLTAKAIAEQVGIINNNFKAELIKKMRAHLSPKVLTKFSNLLADGVITGDELDQVSDDELEQMVRFVKIFARTRPEQKLRIVEALQNNGEIVAMTGDGINDAPALKSANIGVAMGITGTNVAKESATMVLQDDNFATIVTAIKQGRGIYENIEKFIVYLISQNFNEIILILLGLIFLGPELVPLTALQILMINTFDEIIPSLGLGFDGLRDGIMKRKPRKPDASLLSTENISLIFSTAVFMAVASFTAFILSNPQESTENLDIGRTIVYASISVMIMLRPFSFRSLTTRIRLKDIWANKILLLGSIFSITFSLILIYFPPISNIFEFHPLAFNDWLIPVFIGIINIGWIELSKFGVNKFIRNF